MNRIIPHGFREVFHAASALGALSYARHGARHLVAPALALALAIAASTGRAQDDAAPPADAVTAFRVVVEAPPPLRQLLERGLDLVRWQDDRRMTFELLDLLAGEARSQAARAAAAEGYFSAQVSTAIEREKDVAVVRIAVAPGPRTTVAAVDLRFRGAVATDGPEGPERMAAVRRAWPLPPGEPFRQVDWDAAKRTAVDTLARRRYVAAAVASSEARVDPERNTATLTVELDSGPPFRFGAVEVSGTRRYPPELVENLNPIQPGEPYDATRLAVLQRRLLETGYFATVQLAVDPDPARADATPLRIAVVEARTQRIDTGVLASTDTRLGLQLNYSNQDFLDRALRLRSALRLDARTQVLDTSVDTPPRRSGYWNTLSGRFEATDIQGQRTEGGMLGVSQNWGLESTPSQVTLSAHAERQVVAGSITDHHHAVFLGFRQTFRITDDPLLPRRGVLGLAQVGASLPGLATREFVRGAGRITFLLPLGPASDVTLRAEGGIVFANSRFGIPSTFLFRTGGDQTVRGYAYQSLGVPQGNAIVGGRYLAIASAEYTWWFAGDWGAAAFVDAGDAFDNRHEFEAAVGYGVGVRWRSPIGPFRADVAYGDRAKSLRLHFSVGFAL